MSKVRINDLARELEVKSKSILDALTAVGVTEAKTHSSSIEADEAEKVRNYLSGKRSSSSAASKPQVEAKPAFNLAHISKPGDAVKAILARKQAEEEARTRRAVQRQRQRPPASRCQCAESGGSSQAGLEGERSGGRGPGGSSATAGCAPAEAAHPDCDSRGTAAGDCEQASGGAGDRASAGGGCSPARNPCNSSAAGGSTRRGGSFASGGDFGGSCSGSRGGQAREACRCAGCRRACGDTQPRPRLRLLPAQRPRRCCRASAMAAAAGTHG
jgi:hypothetical protein